MIKRQAGTELWMFNPPWIAVHRTCHHQLSVFLLQTALQFFLASGRPRAACSAQGHTAQVGKQADLQSLRSNLPGRL